MPPRRRIFLRSGAIAVVGFGLTDGLFPGFLARAARSGRAGRKTLVVIFQRGAADGLNIVVPHGEKSYYRLRPSIAIARPAQDDPDAALDLERRERLGIS